MRALRLDPETGPVSLVVAGRPLGADVPRGPAGSAYASLVLTPRELESPVELALVDVESGITVARTERMLDPRDPGLRALTLVRWRDPSSTTRLLVLDDDRAIPEPDWVRLRLLNALSTSTTIGLYDLEDPTLQPDRRRPGGVSPFGTFRRASLSWGFDVDGRDGPGPAVGTLIPPWSDATVATTFVIGRDDDLRDMSLCLFDDASSLSCPALTPEGAAP